MTSEESGNNLKNKSEYKDKHKACGNKAAKEINSTVKVMRDYR